MNNLRHSCIVIVLLFIINLMAQSEYSNFFFFFFYRRLVRTYVVDEIDLRPILFISNSIASLTEPDTKIIFQNKNFVFDVILCYDRVGNKISIHNNVTACLEIFQTIKNNRS